jgi:hypothetical protein
LWAFSEFAQVAEAKLWGTESTLLATHQQENMFPVIFNAVLVIGTTLQSPAILSCIGLSSVGPLAGGAFAASQGAGVVAGSWMAAAQAVAMAPAVSAGISAAAVTATGVATGVATGAGVFAQQQGWLKPEDWAPKETSSAQQEPAVNAESLPKESPVISDARSVWSSFQTATKDAVTNLRGWMKSPSAESVVSDSTTSTAQKADVSTDAAQAPKASPVLETAKAWWKSAHTLAEQVKANVQDWRERSQASSTTTKAWWTSAQAYAEGATANVQKWVKPSTMDTQESDVAK